MLAIQVLLVRSDLDDVPQRLSALQDSAIDGDVPTAKASLAQVSDSTHDARSHSAGPVWWLGSKLPVVGRSLHTSRELVVALDSLTNGPLADLVSVADKLDPDTLVQDGTVNVAALVETRPAILRGATQVAAVDQDVRRLPTKGLLGPVENARTEAVDKIGKLTSLLNGAAEAVRVAPAMLGADGPRTYFLAFQNNAEAKATGGLLGVYGVLTADHGKIDLVKTGSNQELKDFRFGVLDLGPEYNANYGVLFPQSLWSNGNSSPHFPYAAQTWATMYERQFGTHVDGVLAVDPEMLSHLLRATGPIKLADGRSVGADSIVKLVEVDAYAEYDGARNDRKNFLREVADLAFHTALGGHVPARDLLEQLGDAGSTGHIQVWSRNEREMTVLRDADLTGEIYQGTAPYAGVVLNNVSGAKLDYYLDRKVTFTLGSCTAAGRRPGHVEVTLTNTAPPGLPTFVTDRIDAPRGTYPVGQSRLQLSVYLTDGAKLVNVTLNGQAVDITRGTELGHPKITMWVLPTPGQPLTVTVETDEPVSPDEPIIPTQPLHRPQTTEVRLTPCPTTRH